MPELVAFEDPPGPSFVAELTAAWDRGDAVFPVDHRLPRAAREALYAAIRPTQIVSGHARRACANGRPTEDGDAVVLATSGTTGAPKGVVLTRAAIEASAHTTSRRLGVDPERDLWLGCLPVAHAGGLGVVTRALMTGTTLHLMAGFDAAVVTGAARESAKRVLVSLVATALRRIDPALFKTILLGGDTPPRDLPPQAVVTYGLTETGGGCVYDGVPLDAVDVRVDETGEVRVRGPLLARAYRTAGGDIEIGDDLATGDGGRWEDGRLRVHGRMAEVIVTGGEKVWPAAVEEVIRRCRGVAAAAVVGNPDPEWGQRVVAVVVPTRDPPSLEDLRGAVKECLGPWAAPKELRLVDRLPTTSSGKVRRAAI